MRYNIFSYTDDLLLISTLASTSVTSARLSTTMTSTSVSTTVPSTSVPSTSVPSISMRGFQKLINYVNHYTSSQTKLFRRDGISVVSN